MKPGLGRVPAYNPSGATGLWQILGAVAAAERSQPVAWLARDLGANRQNVQRIINDLYEDGLVAFATNPHHRRAQLVVLTEKGRQAFAAAATPAISAQPFQ